MQPRLACSGSLLVVALLAAGLPAAPGAAVPATPPVAITLRALPDRMRYDLAEIKIFAGDRVRLEFRNDDFMPHNVVICRPRAWVTPGAEEDNGMEVAQAAWTLGERATALNWVPEHPRVFASTKILDGQARQVIEFTAPERPGRFPYVCTFPGHAASMWGILHVQARVDGLHDLRYRIFRGPFSAFPDFAALSDRVSATGALPDGLIDAGVGGEVESFAVEFEGLLPVDRDDDYAFTVAGDTGPVLLIDGLVIVDHRASDSWASSATKSVRLTRGDHRLVLRYWHRRDRRKPRPEVTLLWSSGAFKELPLSRLDLIARHRELQAEQAIGMPIGPSGDEPILYRNYLAGVLPSGFGVGYPGGVNLTWDPRRMNIGTVWAGAFYDAKRHRTLRGGTIKPAGFALADPGPGYPLAWLAHPADAWPEHAPDGHAAFRFLGYTFDAQRRPAFRYRCGEIAVTDFFQPHGTAAAGDLRLTRTLTLTAPAPIRPGLMFRVLHGRGITSKGGGVFQLAGTVTVQAGPSARFRPAGESHEVLRPVVFRDGRAKIEIRYSWSAHHR